MPKSHVFDMYVTQNKFMLLWVDMRACVLTEQHALDKYEVFH